MYILPGNEILQPPQEKQEDYNEETDSRLVLYDEKLFKLVNNVGDGLCLFYSVSSCLKKLHSQGSWSKYINMTDSKTLSVSNVIEDLAEFLCTICEADFNTIVQYYGFVIENDTENDTENDLRMLLKIKLRMILRMILRKKINKNCHLNMHC